jgi:hypothetical protein
LRGDVRARPRPLKIESADAAVHVEHLADEIEPRADARLHRRRVDLVERHTAGRGLRVAVPAAAGDRQRPLDQGVHEAAPFVAGDVGQLTGRIDLQSREHRGGNRSRDVGRERNQQGALRPRRRRRRPLCVEAVE